MSAKKPAPPKAAPPKAAPPKAVPSKAGPAKSGPAKSGPAKPGPAKPVPPKAAAKAAPNEAPTAKPCPICGKPQVERYRPFCSKRCADIDLNRWLTGAYAIPVVEEEDEDGDTPGTKQG